MSDEDLRKEAVTRLAASLDVPARVLTGMGDPPMPTRLEAYEDALRQIAWEVGTALGEGRSTIDVPAIDAPLAALLALGYVPRSPAAGRRPLTADTPP